METEKITLQPPKGIPVSMLEKYIDRCRTDIRSAKDALASSDYARTRVFGHRLRGTGAAYGIAAFTEIGGLIETASSAGDHAEVERQLEALDSYLSRIEISAG